MPTATPNYLPQGERLLEGTITSGQLSASATSCDVSNPPSTDKLPTYFEFEPDNEDKRETVRVTDVSGSTITFVRGVYNSGTGKIHASNSAYKQKFTEKHIEGIVDAIQDGWLKEDASLSLTRDSDTQFTITGIDHTAYYTAGRLLRFNTSDSNIAIVASSSLSGSDTVVTIDDTYTIPATLTTVEIAVQPRGGADKYLLETDLLDEDDITSDSATAAPTQQSSKAYVDSAIQEATDGATVTFDLGSGAYRKHKVTLGGNRTLALSNELVGQAFIIDLIQDGTGSRTVTWFSTIKWVGGSEPTLTTDANAIDTFGFIVTSAGNYQGYVVGQNVS